MIVPSQKSLIARRDELLKLAVEKRQSSQLADMDLIVKKISDYNAVISSVANSNRKDRNVAISIWLLCVFVVGAVWLVPMPRTGVVLTAEVQAVNFKAVEDLHWANEISLCSEVTELNHMADIRIPQVHSDSHANGDYWARIEGGRLQLSEMRLPAGGELSIRSLPGKRIEFRSRFTPFSGKFTLTGEAQLISGSIAQPGPVSSQLNLRYPEYMEFQSSTQNVVPAMVGFCLEDELRLYGLNIKELGFSQLRTTSAGEDKFFSSIITGKLMLMDTSESYELNVSESLSLAGIEGRLAELRVKDSIILRFEGLAEEILIGPEELRRNVMPSILQYIYHREPLALFISAVTFLWGLSWSIKRVLFQ